MKTFINMLKDDSGASAAEYALILAIIGSVIAIAAIGLANAVGNSMKRASSCINWSSQVPLSTANSNGIAAPLAPGYIPAAPPAPVK